MKNSRFTVLFLAMVLVACQPPIVGSGNYKKASLTPKPYNAILCDLAGNIELIANANYSGNCIIEAQENILPYITTNVVDSELVITLKQDVRIKKYDSVNIKIYTAQLQSVKILGASNCIILDSLTTARNMLCAIMGAGNITIYNGTYNDLRLQMSGNGLLKANNCKALSGNYALKGTGIIEAANSKVGSLKAIIDGAGIINAWAVDSIWAETKDAGNLTYSGSPTYVKTKPGKAGVITNRANN